MPTEIKDLFDKLPNYGSDEVEAVFPNSKSTPYLNSKAVNVNGFHGGVGTEKKNGRTDDGGFTDSGSASRFFYTAKSSKSERNAGLEGFEERLGGAMSGKEYRDDRPPNHTMRANHHPTVKPLSLTKYLATLIKPPTGGRLLVPFSGSGSEMIGALQAGWEYVEGVELTEEYIPIAEARIKYWQNIPQTSSKPKPSAKKAEDIQTEQQELLQI